MAGATGRRNVSRDDDSYVQRAFVLMDEMEHVASTEMLRDKIFVLLAEGGVEHFTIARLPQADERIAPHMMLRRWPEAWLRHYDRNGYFRDDPVARQCFATFEPFAWSDVPVNLERQPRAARIMSEAAEHGLRDGLSIPIHDARGHQAIVSMAGERLDMTPKMRRAVHLVSLYAFGAGERLLGRGAGIDATPLSPRERDVLAWMASGRTAEQTADVLGIRRTTVESHLLRARQKLGTLNTTHTVVEALRRGQLQL
jgi:LuxR family quorum sensing-dependent transcriptional regulator